MRKFTLQELDCAIKTAETKLDKLSHCCVAWEKIYGKRNIKLEELRKYTTQLIEKYSTQSDAFLQEEEWQDEEANTSEMYPELNRLKKELKTINEAKEKLKELGIYAVRQESEQNRTLINPSEVQLFENLHRFVNQEHSNLHDQIRAIYWANNSKNKALKSTTDLTLPELKRTIKTCKDRLQLKQIQGTRYEMDFNTKDPEIEREKSELQQSLDSYNAQLHNRTSK
jgi:hypothetical protein